MSEYTNIHEPLQPFWIKPEHAGVYCVMQTFFRNSNGGARNPAISGEQCAANCSSGSVEQPAQSFSSIRIRASKQAVITKGNRIRASLDGQTAGPASRAEQPAPLAGNASSDGASASTGAQPAPLAGAASSAGEPAVAGRTSKRRLDNVCAAQPTLPTKRLRDSAVMKLLQGHPQASESS